MSLREVSAFAPATVANLGLGFDILGLALSGYGDTVHARPSTTPGVTLVEITGDGGRLPLDPAKNAVGVAAAATLKRAGLDHGVELRLEKGLPLGSGLGSSAASAVASAVAVNALFGSPLRRRDLLEPCLEAEALVSARHLDNVAPALLGGLILVRSIDPIEVIRLPLPEELRVVVASPAYELNTADSRRVLPEAIDLPDLVTATANIAALSCACFTGDLALLSRSMVSDPVTLARLPLIPGGAEVVDAALRAGALGSAISGSGPAIFALARSEGNAQQVGQAMAAAFTAAGLDCKIMISPAENPGARVL